jgi:hypothetical protein
VCIADWADLLCNAAGMSQPKLHSNATPVTLGEPTARRPLYPATGHQVVTKQMASNKKPQIFRSAGAMLGRPTFRPAADLPLNRSPGAQIAQVPGNLGNGSTTARDAPTPVQASHHSDSVVVFSTAKGKAIGQSSKTQQTALSMMNGLEWSTTPERLPRGAAPHHPQRHHTPASFTRAPAFHQVNIP